MQPDTRGIPVSQAAGILGISVAATRKRVQRGTLRGYKVDGQWMVVLPVSIEPAYDTGTPADVGHGYDTGKDALIAQLQAENARLWDLVARLAGERALSVPHGVGEGPPLGSAPPMPRAAAEKPIARRNVRAWWQRLTGGRWR